MKDFVITETLARRMNALDAETAGKIMLTYFRHGGLTGESPDLTPLEELAYASVFSESGGEAGPGRALVPKPPKAAKSAKRFVPPEPDEVREYCAARNNGIDAESFVGFYAAKGWKVGNQSMKDWKAAVRTWEARESGGAARQAAGGRQTRDPFEQYAREAYADAIQSGD